MPRRSSLSKQRWSIPAEHLAAARQVVAAAARAKAQAQERPKPSDLAPKPRTEKS